MTQQATATTTVWQSIKLLKAVEQPQMRQEDVPQGPPYRHHDTGLYFTSRSALKKAIRITWNGAGTSVLKQKNRFRFNQALRRIASSEGIDFQRIAREEVRELLARAVPASGIQNQFIIAMKEVVAEALGFKKEASWSATTSKKLEAPEQFKEWLRKLALDEARRLVLDSMTIDIAINGSAHQPASRPRAMQLLQPPALEE